MRVYIILFAMTLSFVSACKKEFLQVVDKTVLLEEGYVVDLKTTGHYLNGIYSQLATVYALGTSLPYSSLVADDMKPQGDGLVMFGDIYNWRESAGRNESGSFSKGIWNTMYKIIKCCNLVIEKSTEFEAENVDYALTLRGQALTIRSWMHFMLVNTFAQSFNYTDNASHLGVPYVKTSDIQEKVVRHSVAEVYDAMVADLQEAIKILPLSVNNKELMNRRAAQALLARIYLFKNDFTHAKELSCHILNEVPLMKLGYPDKLYTKDETEALFYLAPAYSEANRYTPIFMGYFTSSYIIYLATDDITELYRSFPTDKRNVWITDSTIGKVINKFPKNATGSFLLPEGDHYQTFLRSSEMVLTAAEAYAQLNNQDSARFFINEIRNRANIDKLAVDVSGAALIDSIRVERRKEMAFDGIRMFDLLRWKQGVQRMDALNTTAQNLPYPSNKAIFPIPFEDVQIAGLPQNEGY